jgi:hypothetical protein
MYIHIHTYNIHTNVQLLMQDCMMTDDDQIATGHLSDRQLTRKCTSKVYQFHKLHKQCEYLSLIMRKKKNKVMSSFILTSWSRSSCSLVTRNAQVTYEIKPSPQVMVHVFADKQPGTHKIHMFLNLHIII